MTKPKIACSSCGAELAWGVAKCPSCGTGVEWPGTPEAQSQRPAEKPASGSSMPLRNILLVVGAIAVAVFLLEYFTGPSAVPSAPQEASQGQAAQGGANMAALPHIQELEAKVKANPQNIELKRELGNHLMDNGFYDRAIASYKEFLAQNPSDPNVRVDMGICYKEMGNMEMAKQEMRTALQYAPKHLHAHFNLGIVHLVDGDVKGAAEWFRKTNEIAPESDLGKKAKQLLDQHINITAQ